MPWQLTRQILNKEAKPSIPKDRLLNYKLNLNYQPLVLAIEWEKSMTFMISLYYWLRLTMANTNTFYNLSWLPSQFHFWSWDHILLMKSFVWHMFLSQNCNNPDSSLDCVSSRRQMKKTPLGDWSLSALHSPGTCF